MATADPGVLRDPIFVVGAPRSGTAIMADILSASPGIAYAREPRLVWRYGNDHKSDMLEQADARPEVVAHIRSTFERLVRSQRGHRLVEKLPSNSLRLPFVQAVFPDARFIHILRDGPDAVAAIRDRWRDPRPDLRAARQRDRLVRHLREASVTQYPRYAGELLRKLAPRRPGRALAYRPWGPRLPAMRQLHRELDLLELCALQWRTCVERAVFHGRRLPASRYTEVHVDRLDPDTIGEVARFCDLDPGPLIDTFTRLYDPSRVVARGAGLSPDELDRVRAWIAPTEALLAAPANGHALTTAR